jgi:hypothetical protein
MLRCSARCSRCACAHDQRPPSALSSPSKPGPDSTVGPLAARANHGGTCPIRWRWMGSRSHMAWARRCIASHPFRSRRVCGASSPTFTLPVALHGSMQAFPHGTRSALSAARRCPKPKSNAQALRWWTSSSTAQPRLRRAPSGHASHARRPDQSAYAPASGSRCKFGPTTVHMRCTKPAPTILFPTSSLPPFPPFPVPSPPSSAVLAWSPTPSYHPSLLCHVVTSEAPISMFARARAFADRHTTLLCERKAVLYMPESSVDSRRAPRLSGPALPAFPFSPHRYPRPARPTTTSRLPPCSLLASLSYTMLSASKSGG